MEEFEFTIPVNFVFSGTFTIKDVGSREQAIEIIDKHVQCLLSKGIRMTYLPSENIDYLFRSQSKMIIDPEDEFEKRLNSEMKELAKKSGLKIDNLFPNKKK